MCSTTSLTSSPWFMATAASVSVGWNPQLLQPPTWYFWNSARCADGKTVVTCCMVQAPDKCLGSVLAAPFGSISGLRALVLRSSLAGVGAGGVFFPKILEIKVAILDVSL